LVISLALKLHFSPACCKTKKITSRQLSQHASHSKPAKVWIRGLAGLLWCKKTWAQRSQAFCACKLSRFCKLTASPKVLLQGVTAEIIFIGIIYPKDKTDEEMRMFTHYLREHNGYLRVLVMFSLCWLLTLLCLVANWQDIISSHVSSISAGSLLLSPLLPDGPGPASACPLSLHCPQFRTRSGKFWSRQLPGLLLGTNILNYNLEHFESIQSFTVPPIWESCKKIKHSGHKILNTFPQYCFFRYVEIIHSLQTKFFLQKNGFRFPKVLLTVCMLILLCVLMGLRPL
jgi:hypothetical protein